jgi:hypothetical protein
MGSQMAVKSLVLGVVFPLPARRFQVFFSVRGLVEPNAIVWLEGIGKLKNVPNLMKKGTRDLSACSAAPQSIMPQL